MPRFSMLIDRLAHGFACHGFAICRAMLRFTPLHFRCWLFDGEKSADAIMRIILMIICHLRIRYCYARQRAAITAPYDVITLF